MSVCATRRVSGEEAPGAFDPAQVRQFHLDDNQRGQPIRSQIEGRRRGREEAAAPELQPLRERVTEHRANQRVLSHHGNLGGS